MKQRTDFGALALCSMGVLDVLSFGPGAVAAIADDCSSNASEGRIRVINFEFRALSSVG
jgi:hypothetical protein